MLKIPMGDHRVELALAKSMSFINSTSECKPFCDWIRDELVRLDAVNRGEQHDIVLRQRQGGCMVLADLSVRLRDAEEYWRKLKESEKEIR